MIKLLPVKKAMHIMTTGHCKLKYQKIKLGNLLVNSHSYKILFMLFAEKDFPRITMRDRIMARTKVSDSHARASLELL